MGTSRVGGNMGEGRRRRREIEYGRKHGRRTGEGRRWELGGGEETWVENWRR